MFFEIKSFFFLVSLMIGGHLSGQQTIADVKSMPFGAVVTTTGTLSCSGEFGVIRYMQDATAGIAVFDSDLSFTQAGDSVLVTGVLSEYRGQVQISPVFSFELLGGEKEVESLVVGAFDSIPVSAYESRRILIPCSGIASCEPQFEEGAYTLFDPAGSRVRLWISEDIEDEQIAISPQPYMIEGVWTKFEDQYELLAQVIAVTNGDQCHYLPTASVSFDEQDIVLTWESLPAGETTVWIGEDTLDTSYEIGMWENTLSFTPDALSPGSLYQAVIRQENSEGQLFQSMPVYFSPPSENEPVEVLFNRDVNTSFSDGSAPAATGASVIQTDLIDRIDQVQFTLDVAMYNTSRSAIVAAINRAVSRGVEVRFIADDGTSNSALDGVQNFPIRYRKGDGIMHNKFLIGDAAEAQLAWVWGGSTNLTTNQLSTDPNHAYVIHDQHLALNYKKEFDELWGSLPDQDIARYGDFKTDNTGHIFLSHDGVYESYFSPSDETACHIIEALRTTDYHVQIGLLLLTHFDLIDEIIDLHQAGKDVRVILEDEDSSETALFRLRQAGVSVFVHDPNPIFHHKYAIIDEGYPDSDPQVLTGSHNWTWSADNINDENTLIIHDQSVTNIFRQEFEARWEELNPTTVTLPYSGEVRLYPNPATTFLTIEFPQRMSGQIHLMDINGRIILSDEYNDSESTVLDIRSSVPTGCYLLQIVTEHRVQTNRLVIH